MKLTTKKQMFLDDFSIIKINYLASFISNSRLLTVILLLFSSTLSINFNAFSNEVSNQHIPVKKVNPVSTKNVSPKITKRKAKGKKNKKSIVVKKDTLKDIDPASANSPLFNY